MGAEQEHWDDCPRCRGLREEQRVADGAACRVCSNPLTLASVLSNPSDGFEGVCKWCAASYRPPRAPEQRERREWA